jgi:hypothetical protein
MGGVVFVGRVRLFGVSTLRSAGAASNCGSKSEAQDCLDMAR